MGWNVGNMGEGPGLMGGAPAMVAPSPAVLDRHGRDPADVQAMLTERARRQYEQRFGSYAPGNDTASLAAQGNQTELDALIRRLGAGADHRMNLMRR
jgi:hypothetical protein